MKKVDKYLTDIIMSLSNKDYVLTLNLVNKISKKDREILFLNLKNTQYEEFIIYYNKFN